MLSNHLFLCHPLLILPSIFSRIRVLCIHFFKWGRFLWTYFKELQNQFSQFSHSVMSDSLRPHGLQHTRLPCPSPTPGDYSNSCPLSWWCHPTISSSVTLFFSCLQCFPASGSFPVQETIMSLLQHHSWKASILWHSVFFIELQDILS